MAALHRLKRIVDDEGRPIYLRPQIRTNPADVDSNASLKVSQVADRLGTDRETVRRLADVVDDRGRPLLSHERNGRREIVVTERALTRFIEAEVEPVEEVAEPPTPPAAAGVRATQPARPAATAAPAKLTRALLSPPRQPVVVDLDADEEQEEDLTAPQLVEVTCPNPDCSAPLEVSHGVMLAECPDCGRRMAFEWPDATAPEDEPAAAAATARANPLRRLLSIASKR